MVSTMVSTMVSGCLNRGKKNLGVFQEILNLRAMELKHGRVAMLAVLGWFHVAAGYLER